MADTKLNIEVVAKSQSLKDLNSALRESKNVLSECINTFGKYADTTSKAASQVQKFQQQVNTTKQSMKELGAGTKTSTFQLLEFGENLTVVSAGLMTVFNNVNKYIGDAVAKSLEFTKSLEMLKFASDEITFKGLQSFNANFKTGSIFSQKDIINGETFLSLQGRTEEQIKKTIQAAMDLSVATGDDLESAIRKLDMTFEGSIGRLGRLDERIKDVSVSELENGKAIDIIGEKYSGLANKQAETLSGKILILKKNFNALEKSLGDSIIKEVGNWFDYTNKSAKDLGSTFETVKKTIDGLVAGFGLILRVVPNLYTVIKTGASAFDAWGSVMRFIRDDTYSFGDAVTDIIDKVTDAVPHLRLLKGIYGYFKADNEKLTTPVDLYKTMTGYVKSAYDKVEGRYSNKYDFAIGPEQVKDKGGPRGSNRNENLGQEKKQLDDIEKLYADIKELETKRDYYLKTYPEYLGIQRDILNDIYEKTKKLNELKSPFNTEIDFSKMGLINEKDTNLPLYSDKGDSFIKKSSDIEIYDNALQSLSRTIKEVTSSFGEMFGKLVMGGDALAGLKSFLKQTLQSVLTFVEGMILASKAKAFADSVLSFGATLIKELPELFLAVTSLELARGFVGALYTGGSIGSNQFALVGDDRGRITPQTELIHGTARVYNNEQLRNLISPQNNNIQPPIINVKVAGNLRDMVKVGIEQLNKRNVLLSY